MLSPPLLAFASAVAALAAAADLLAAAERARAWALATRAIRTLRRVAATEPDHTRSERRRFAALVAGTLLAGGWLVGGALAGLVLALAGPAGAAALLRARRRRHEEAVRAGAAGTALAMASALASGHSVRGALAEAATDVPGAAGAELRAATRALELGEPTDRVLERLRTRAAGGTWDTLVAAILLQRDAGGDLAGLLRDLARSLDAAERARRDARAATAQSRLTAWIVAGLPAGAAVLAELASPGFLVGLLADPLSAILALTAAALDLVAILTIRRLARVRA